jgi:copper chaperone
MNLDIKTIKVRGMTCAACVESVTRAVKAVPGVTQAKVDLKAGTATVTFDPFHAAESDFRDAIQDEGYETP